MTQTANTTAAAFSAADEKNIGRLAMVTKDGRTYYGMVDGVALIRTNDGDLPVYGFVYSTAEAWVSRLVTADSVKWCESADDMDTARESVMNYIDRQAKSLTAARARAKRPEETRRIDTMLSRLSGLYRYL